MNTLLNLDDLRSFSYFQEPVFIQGYNEIGDQGEGIFYWDSSNTDSDNDGTIVQVTGVSTGRWKRFFSGAVNVRWFGANLRFSNAPFNGSVISVNEKGYRLNGPEPLPGLTVSLHIYDSMIDVCEGDFIRLGEYGSGNFRIYNSQFFDVWSSVVKNPVKTTGGMDTVSSLFEFRDCNFQGCGICNIDSPAAFVYSGDENAEFIFTNTYFTTATKMLKISNGTYKYQSDDNSDSCYLLYVTGFVESLIVDDNEIYKKNTAAYASIQFQNEFSSTNYKISNNIFVATAGVHIYSDNPSANISNGKLTGNQFSYISGATDEAIFGNINPGIIVSQNVFYSKQNVRGIATENHGMYGRTIIYASAPPSSGTYYHGDRTINDNPSVGNPKSWVCTVDGTPGTWVSEGNL